MSKDSTSPSARAKLRSAITEIAAAERLAADPDLGPALARPHLEKAWEGLHGAASSDEDLVSWSGSQAGREMEEQERERFDRVRRWTLGLQEGDEEPSVDDLFAHAAVLRRLGDGGSGARRARSGFALVGAGLVAITLVTMAVSAVVSVVRGPIGPWRGEWYDNQDFKGDPQIERTRRIEYDWGRDAPKVRGLGQDRWSVIWRTCLEVDEDTEVRFRVSSDDGARLYVDGEMVVDNWGAHAVRTRTGKTSLSQGVHYVRLDFFEASATAEIKLLASFGEDREYESVPVGMLSEPGEGDDPC